MFINDRSNNPNDITTLWIENSPCAKCSRALLGYFKNHHKPTIYVGQIWRPNNRNDDQGLINLMKAGFKIKVWGMFSMFGSTAKYLHNLEKQAKVKQYKDL